MVLRSTLLPLQKHTHLYASSRYQAFVFVILRAFTNKVRSLERYCREEYPATFTFLLLKARLCGLREVLESLQSCLHTIHLEIRTDSITFILPAATPALYRAGPTLTFF